jgi:diamine N-acetyltransferase
MSNELLDRIDETELPEPIRAALKGLAQAAEPLLPDLPPYPRQLVSSLLGRVIDEAADPATDTHWWEVNLDLIAKTANSEAVGAAAERLLPLLRPRMGSYEEVTLREITGLTVRGICRLSDTLTEPQKSYVASNAVSLAQAHFAPQVWFRAIYAGPAPVGFLMLEDPDEEQDYFLFRFMIAEPYQRRGYGRQAIQRLVEYVRTRPGATELLTSCGEGEGGPKGFYLKLGFEPTGQKVWDEIILRLPLD